jgi:CheY-like chemotaxis protein
MEGIGQLTGGVAHDFNNLLTIIIGNLGTLQRNLGSGDVDIARLLRSADNAMRGARRAESLTQRLLAFSRQQPLDPKPLDLGRLVTGMSDLLRRTLGEQVTVETVLGGGVWRALADPNQLELTILNLAVNARDAMPKGGKLTLETANVHLDDKYASTQAEVLPGQYVMLAVTDNGCGMTPEVKAKAFDPFFTTKDVGHGTGLGLSQVYGFVKQSRGHVKIYSEVGEGTTIKVYLPRVHAPADFAEDETERSPAPGARNETILVVEDDADVRNYSCETLRELGYSVLEAENGRVALRLLESDLDIQLLFTDIGLPGGMNGRQLSQEARKRRPGLKVLFTTGYARNAIVHEGRLDPGVELITKPFTQAALAAKLRDIIDAKRVPGRILLVEDEALIMMLATEYLEEAGFTVETASSAAQAMNKIGLVPGGLDAVIVDIGLPDRRGDALLREIRAIHPLLPIVLATGHATGDLRRTLADEHKISFVTKPYTAEDLLGALSSVGIRGHANGVEEPRKAK